MSRIVLSGVLWLVSAALPAALRAQAETDNPNPSVKINTDAAEPQSSSNASSSPAQSTSKSSDRIFGVVPAYNITDAQNAPPLTPDEKFVLFAKGTLDPFPFVAYALEAGVSQATDAAAKSRTGLATKGWD